MDRSMLKSRGDDRISELGDDILISIISKLTLGEATATSILSSRWRYLCTYVTHLIFPPFKPKSNVIRDEDRETKGFPKYIKMINDILDSHKGGRVKELRVQMPCLEGADIDKWLEFALAKEVEIIEIGMSYLVNARLGHYLFHLETLIRPGLLFKGLKELCLGIIHVDDSEIEFLLSNSPHLERLSVRFSERLRKVSILGRPAYMLKHLHIHVAPNLEFIEIDNMINLVSLHFHHLPPYVLTLNKVPNLVEFSATDEFRCTLGHVFSRVGSSICDQLRTLKLLLHSDFYPAALLQRETLPQFKSVKHLELQRRACYACSLNLSRLFDMIQTCPSLEKLEIKIMWGGSHSDFPENGKDERVYGSLSRKELSPYLKKIKFSGFLGSSAELGLAFSILRKMVNNSVEEFIVEACDVTEQIRGLATARAWQHFRPIIPDSVTFLVN